MSYTTTLIYDLSGYKVLKATSTATATGTYVCMYSAGDLVLDRVSSRTVTVGSASETVYCEKTEGLPDFTSITSIESRIIGSTLDSLYLYNSAGTLVSLSTTSGSFDISQIAAVEGLGASSDMKIKCSKKLKAYGPEASEFPTSNTSIWSPQYMTDPSAGIEDERTKSCSASSTNTEFVDFDTTVVLTITYEGNPPPPPTPEPGKGDYKNYSLVIDKNGVSVGGENTGTESDKHFECYIDSKFGGHVEAKNSTFSKEWTEIAIDGTNITTGTGSYGLAGPGVWYRVDAGHRVIISVNVKFVNQTGETPTVKTITTQVPIKWAPKKNVYKIFTSSYNSYANNHIGNMIVTPDGMIQIQYMKNPNSSNAPSFTSSSCDCFIEYFK